MPASYYAWWFAASALVGVAVGAFALTRRGTPGTRWFAFSAFSQSFWTTGHLFELLTPTLEGKLFWDDLEFLGTCGWAIGLSRFCASYAGREGRAFRRFQSANVVVCLGYLALVFTDRFHRLIRPEMALVPGGPTGVLVYPFTVPSLVVTAYLLVIFSVSAAVLFRHFRHAQQFFRAQIAFVIAGAFLPLVSVVATVAGVAPGEDRDTTPFTFAFGDLLVAFGLFRYRFFDLVPIARDVVVDNLDSPVVVTDSKDRVVDVNPAALRLTGGSIEEVIGGASSDVFGQWPELAGGLRGGGEDRVPLAFRLDGEERYFDLSSSPILDRNGTLIGRVGVTHDVTALKRAEDALAERNRLLESAYRELDAFTFSVSHDLRAPLRQIQGFATLLLRTQAENLDAQGKEQLELLTGAAERMRRLFEDLLRFAKLGSHPLARRTVDPTDLARLALSELSQEVQSRSADVRVDTLPACVGDPSLLRQVFSNLLGNALKYSRTRESPRIEVGSLGTGEAPVYYVRDNGVGFDMRHADRLFRVFQRLHDAERFEGNGVGLAIVASIVQRHGGRVWAESTLDAGATFFFTLPAGSS